MNPQYFIALFGLGAVYLSMVSQNQRLRKWAPLVGLCGQPFWLYVTSTSHQWGMFALCIAYSLLYAKGAYLALTPRKPK